MRRMIFAGLIVAGVASTSQVHAQPPHTSAAARLFNDGREAMKRDDFAVAYDKLQQSQRLDPSPGTLLNIAICEEKLGKLTDAQAHLQEVLAQIPGDDPRALLAREHAAAIEGRLPRLSLLLDAAAPRDTRISLDGNDLATDSLRTPLSLNPGRHIVRVGAGGRTTRTIQVELAEGERKALRLEFEAAQRPAAEGTNSTSNALGYVLLGVGAAGVAAGGVMWAVLNKKQDIVDNHCDAQKRCSQDGIDAANAGEKLTPFYTGAWLVGAAGLGAGAYVLLTDRGTADEGTMVGVTVLPGGGAVGATGRF